jgi:hypothetical protein
MYNLKNNSGSENFNRVRSEPMSKKQKKRRAAQHSIFAVVMPNGKSLGECTFGEVAEMSKKFTVEEVSWLQRQMEGLIHRKKREPKIF